MSLYPEGSVEWVKWLMEENDLDVDMTLKNKIIKTYLKTDIKPTVDEAVSINSIIEGMISKATILTEILSGTRQVHYSLQKYLDIDSLTNFQRRNDYLIRTARRLLEIVKRTSVKTPNYFLLMNHYNTGSQTGNPRPYEESNNGALKNTTKGGRIKGNAKQIKWVSTGRKVTIKEKGSNGKLRNIQRTVYVCSAKPGQQRIAYKAADGTRKFKTFKAAK